MSCTIFNDGINFCLSCTADELPNKARDVWTYPEEFEPGLSEIREYLRVSIDNQVISLRDYMRTLLKLVVLPKRFVMKYPDLKWSVRAMRYARNDFKEPVGVVVIDLDGFVGISMLNTHKGDQWDPVAGIRKALYRTAQKRTLYARLEEFDALAHGDHGSPAFRENASAVFQALSAVSNDQVDTVINEKTPTGFVDMAAAERRVVTQHEIPTDADPEDKPENLRG